MADETRPLKVLGHLREFSDDRIVFVGRSEDHPGKVYLACRNAEGDDTYLVFSAEAAEALAELLAGKDDDRPYDIYPHRKTWRAVSSK